MPTKSIYIRGTPEERFWPKVDKSGDCWLWTAACTYAGYGQFGVAYAYQVFAHRFAWELEHGPIPDDMEIDHLCGTRNCVRVSHLDLVTRRINVHRAKNWEGGASFQRAKTHCRNGHPFDESNTAHLRNGSRACRICQRAATKKARIKRLANLNLNGIAEGTQLVLG